MTAPAYELIDRYLWINAAASSIELTENELLSLSQIVDIQRYEPLLNLENIADKESAERMVERILSRIDNPHLSANFDNYLNEYIRLKKQSAKNKVIETMTYYIYEFYRIAEIYFNSAFSTPAPQLRQLYQDYIQSDLKNVSNQTSTDSYCPRIADPYQRLPWYQRFLARFISDPEVEQMQKLSFICRKTHESIRPVWCKLSVFKVKAPASEFNPWNYIQELAAMPYEQAAAKARADFQTAEQQKKDMDCNFAAAGQKLKLAILNRIKTETVSALLHAKIIRHFDRVEHDRNAVKLSGSNATT